MRVALGKFARSSIEARFGPDIAAGVQAALLHYTRRLKSGRPPVGIPRLSRGPVPLDTGAAFELAVSQDMQAALEREARRHKVPVGQIVEHAVFVYLADLDSASEGESNAWHSSALGAR
jgi:hypothetical protein